MRLNTDGSLDTTFSGDGIVTLDFGTETIKSSPSQSDGSIVSVGYVNNPTTGFDGARRARALQWHIIPLGSAGLVRVLFATPAINQLYDVAMDGNSIVALGSFRKMPAPSKRSGRPPALQRRIRYNLRFDGKPSLPASLISQPESVGIDSSSRVVFAASSLAGFPLRPRCTTPASIGSPPPVPRHSSTLPAQSRPHHLSDVPKFPIVDLVDLLIQSMAKSSTAALTLTESPMHSNSCALNANGTRDTSFAGDEQQNIPDCTSRLRRIGRRIDSKAALS